MPTVEVIFLIGVHRAPYTFFLVILLAESEKRPEGEMSNMIEDQCKHLFNLYVIVHKTVGAQLGLEAGSRFWTAVRTYAPVIYQAPGVQLRAPKIISYEVKRERAAFHWKRWGSQGKSFLEGAAYYLDKENYRLAAFLLHQVAESTLKALVQAILGYRIQMHNLSRLLRLSLLFTEELRKDFKLNTPEGLRLFGLLQSAYSKSRYSNSFDPDEASIKMLMITLTHFYGTATSVYHQYLGKLKDEV